MTNARSAADQMAESVARTDIFLKDCEILSQPRMASFSDMVRIAVFVATMLKGRKDSSAAHCYNPLLVGKRSPKKLLEVVLGSAHVKICQGLCRLCSFGLTNAFICDYMSLSTLQKEYM